MSGKTPVLLVPVLAAALVLCAAAGLMIGPVDLSVSQVMSGLFGQGEENIAIIIQELRVPRVAIGILAGATLGVSGAALQGLLRNPLADPGVIGVSASAGLGAVVAISFGLVSVFPMALQLLAMAGGLCATAVLLYLAARDASILPLILAGIGISSLAAAIMALVMNFAPNPLALQDMVMWLMGSLQNRTFDDLMLTLPFVLVGWGLLLGTGRGLDATSLGEETAITLGINMKLLRLRIILGAALSVGAVVAVCGTVGFVGLVIPHFLRPLVGYAPGRLLLPSALGGAILLLLADMITRLPFGNQQLQLGVVTSLIGAPLFLHIIYKTREAMR
ncbi:FecCD family ABC transporter permease [Emcibacter nanhaiensis]|uniref:Iron ABC transporter permease n=1 Tax=Emcibacter nanhaiensis TaxID=1505037 RepID=A0A501PD61_9PROT|nr:iron ABC transporter permease [Emcibacter nanhaiensis]TPD57896.1 iron ABC transporter permease [Emcibacter nanhaiensis]